MGRRKKKADAAAAAEIPLVVADKEAAVLIPTTQAALASPPENGHSMETPEFMAGIREKAIDQAKECGLKPPFTVAGPDRVNYPRQGHGYIVTIQEQTGKCRLGSARFTSEGIHSYWSLDTLITG